MPEPKDKVKFTMWLHPHVKDALDEMYRQHGFISRSECIEKALIFYGGYLSSNKQQEYLPEVITSTVQSTLGTFEDRMASLLFKMAVELAMLMNVEAAHYRVDDQTLTRLRNKCVGEVKRLHGRVSFDDAVKYQRGD